MDDDPNPIHSSMKELCAQLINEKIYLPKKFMIQ